MRSIVIVILMMFCIQLQAQIKPKETSIVDGWEIWQDKIPVSGGVRVGLMFNDSISPISPNHFYVKIPDNLFNLSLVVNVELSSKDGRYSAKLIYPEGEIEKNSDTNIYRFELPTKFESKLSDYNSDQVVVLATIKKNDSLFYLISAWEEPKNINSVVVYVNSLIPIKIVADNNKEKDCSELDSPTVAYNKKCVVEIKQDELPNMITIKQRVRRMGRTQINLYEIPLKK